MIPATGLSQLLAQRNLRSSRAGRDGCCEKWATEETISQPSRSRINPFGQPQDSGARPVQCVIYRQRAGIQIDNHRWTV